jgi:tetratricopeptide (TPR) repeat protein
MARVHQGSVFKWSASLASRMACFAEASLEVVRYLAAQWPEAVKAKNNSGHTPLDCDSRPEVVLFFEALAIGSIPGEDFSMSIRPMPKAEQDNQVPSEESASVTRKRPSPENPIRNETGRENRAKIRNGQDFITAIRPEPKAEQDNQVPNEESPSVTRKRPPPKNRGNRDKVRIWQLLLETGKKSHGELHSKTAELHYDVGVALLENDGFASSLQNFQRAVDIMVHIEGTEHPKSLTAARFYRGMGDAYCARGDPENDAANDYANSLNSYQEAIRIYEAHNSNAHVAFSQIGDVACKITHPDAGKVYCGMGDAHCKWGKYELAIGHFQAVLAIQQAKLCEKHPDVAKTYSKLGEAYSELGDSGKSLHYYAEASNMDLHGHS